MKSKHKYKLIEGNFAPKEAKEILFALIKDKINFHNKHAFSKAVRFNEDPSRSETRVEQLKQSHDDIKNVIEYASKNGLNLTIKSNIEIIIENYYLNEIKRGDYLSG